VTDSIKEHIEIVEGAGRPKARIRGSRIRVEDVVIWHERQRMSSFEIVHEFPQLTLADVYAALAHYWDHREEMEVAMAEGERFVEGVMRIHPGRLHGMLKNRRAD